MRSAFDHQRGGKFLNFILTFFKNVDIPCKQVTLKLLRKNNLQQKCHNNFEINSAIYHE